MNDSTLDIKAFLDKDEQKDLLRLLTAGSVDDGKSYQECIYRLLPICNFLNLIYYQNPNSIIRSRP